LLQSHVLLQVSTRIILVVGMSPTIEYLYRQPVHGIVHLLVRHSLCSHTLTRLLRLFGQYLGGSMVMV